MCIFIAVLHRINVWSTFQLNTACAKSFIKTALATRNYFQFKSSLSERLLGANCNTNTILLVYIQLRGCVLIEVAIQHRLAGSADTCKHVPHGGKDSKETLRTVRSWGGKPLTSHVQITGTSPRYTLCNHLTRRCRISCCVAVSICAFNRDRVQRGRRGRCSRGVMSVTSPSVRRLTRGGRGASGHVFASQDRLYYATQRSRTVLRAPAYNTLLVALLYFSRCTVCVLRCVSCGELRTRLWPRSRWSCPNALKLSPYQ